MPSGLFTEPSSTSQATILTRLGDQQLTLKALRREHRPPSIPHPDRGTAMERRFSKARGFNAALSTSAPETQVQLWCST
jgi:hypothetical protein